MQQPAASFIFVAWHATIIFVGRRIPEILTYKLLARDHSFQDPGHEGWPYFCCLINYLVDSYSTAYHRYNTQMYPEDTDLSVCRNRWARHFHYCLAQN